MGPSGCGKTTLLKCIVGTLKISQGHINVLGKPPKFPGHNVPGKKVGYMPQVNTTQYLLMLKGVVFFLFGLIEILMCQKIIKIFKKKWSKFTEMTQREHFLISLICIFPGCQKYPNTLQTCIQILSSYLSMEGLSMCILSRK